APVDQQALVEYGTAVSSDVGYREIRACAWFSADQQHHLLSSGGLLKQSKPNRDPMDFSDSGNAQRHFSEPSRYRSSEFEGVDASSRNPDIGIRGIYGSR